MAIVFHLQVRGFLPLLATNNSTTLIIIILVSVTSLVTKWKKREERSKEHCPEGRRVFQTGYLERKIMAKLSKKNSKLKT